jgi:hypothetical protein
VNPSGGSIHQTPDQPRFDLILGFARVIMAGALVPVFTIIIAKAGV